MVDFVRLAATAKRLIDANGRTVTFRASSGDLKTAGQPWLGKESPAAVGTPKAVFVEYSEREIDGTRIRVGDRRLLVASDELGFAPAQGHQVVDDSAVWEVVAVHELRPGPTSILYDCQVRA